MKHIGLIDIGFGNLKSLEAALEICEFTYERITEPNNKEFDLVILPGVGHYGLFIKKLKKSGLFDYVKRRDRENRRLLGICLGMQVMGLKSEEDNNSEEGLALAEFTITSLENRDWRDLVPNIGYWKTELLSEELKKIYGETYPFYYVHSYCIRENQLENAEIIATIFDGKDKYPMAFKNGNTIGVQFHPEKSHRQGIQLIKYCANV